LQAGRESQSEHLKPVQTSSFAAFELPQKIGGGDPGSGTVIALIFVVGWFKTVHH
jgi:hypothetical protein